MEIQHGFRTFPSSDIQPQGGVREIHVLSYHGWNDVGTLLVLDTILSILHTILSCWASCIQRKDHTSFFLPRGVFHLQWIICIILILYQTSIFSQQIPKKQLYILHWKGFCFVGLFPNGWSSEASLLPSGLNETQGMVQPGKSLGSSLKMEKNYGQLWRTPLNHPRCNGEESEYDERQCMYWSAIIWGNWQLDKLL